MIEPHTGRTAHHSAERDNNVLEQSHSVRDAALKPLTDVSVLCVEQTLCGRAADMG